MGTHAEFPILKEDSVWKNSIPEVALPPGLSLEQAWAKHSREDLATEWDPHWDGQLVLHRGDPDNRGGIADLSMVALKNAVSGKAGQRGNAVELDVLWINGVAYVMHDLDGRRQTLQPGAWSLYSADSTEPPPEFIIRDVEGPHYTNKYVPTGCKMTPLFECMDELLALNPKVTMFLDGRNQDGARLVALLSQNPSYLNNAVIQYYPYTFRTAVEFTDMVETYGAAIGWKRTVKLAPVLNVDTLHLLARQTVSSLNYRELLSAGKQWFTSMVEAELNIFGFGIPASGIGKGVKLQPIQIKDLNNQPVHDVAVQSSFIKDLVLLDLITWAKTLVPRRPIIGVCITYSYFSKGHYYTSSFHTGNPVAWPEGPAAHNRMLMGIPGNCFKLGADIAIVDRGNENLSSLLETQIFNFPDDLDYPPNNAVV